MKYIIVIFSLLFFFAFEAKASNCSDCSAPPYSGDTWVDLNVPNTNCSISLRYQSRSYQCNGEWVYELKVTGWVAFIDQTCPWLDDPATTVETAVSLLLSDPNESPFPVPSNPGECIDTYSVEGAGCWYPDKGTGPKGYGTYWYECANSDVCCRPYTVCNDGGTITVSPGTYAPVDCSGQYGSNGRACQPICP